MNAPSQPIHFHRPVTELVGDDKVHTSLYNNAAIFDDEMEKIFRNTWVWVAHVSEVPDVGSYKTHWVGKEPVIVVRDRKKQVRVPAALLPGMKPCADSAGAAQSLN